MEKGNTVASTKKKLDDCTVDKVGASSDAVESKKEHNVEKLALEKEEGGQKNDGNPKKDSNSTPKAPQRSTRSSNNPEFVAKQRHFLQKVNQGVCYQSSEEEDMVTNGSPSVVNKRKRSVSGGPMNVDSGSSAKGSANLASGTGSSSHPPTTSSSSKQPGLPKKRKSEVDGSSRDLFCWVCHRDMAATVGGSSLACEVCLRIYHTRCCHSMDSFSPHGSSPSSSNASTSSRKGWACPECIKIVKAETVGTRSRAMQLISMDQLCALLKHVLIRVRSVTGAEPFCGPVDLQQFPRYREYVANPMDLGLLDRNIRRRTYGSTEAFFADMKWIVHNSIIFNTQHSKLTSIARSMIKICRQELMEIENCPDCYSNAHTRKDNWFIEVCRRPHILVWAKLKGFPHWPAKAMRFNKEGCVDVRFFGAHDRAWVPAKDCFLYSEEMPAPPKNRKKNNLDGCIMEVEDHIKKLKEKFGVFVYAPFRTTFDPSQEEQVIMKMLPKYQPIVLESAVSQQGKASSPVRQISRESPSISAGTEEESEEDQSVEGEENMTRKRVFDAGFDDSMEVPSGGDTNQAEATAGANQPSAGSEKGAEESESGKEKKMKKKTEEKEVREKDGKKEDEKAKESEGEVKGKEEEEGAESGNVAEEMESQPEGGVKEKVKETDVKEREKQEIDEKGQCDTPTKEVAKSDEEEVMESEDKVVSCEEKVVPCEEKVVPCEEKVVPCEEKVVPYEEKVVPREEKVVTCEEKVPCEERVPDKGDDEKGDDKKDVKDEEMKDVSDESEEKEAEERSIKEDEKEEENVKGSKPPIEGKDETVPPSSPFPDRQENSVDSSADGVSKLVKEGEGTEKTDVSASNKSEEKDGVKAIEDNSKNETDENNLWDDMPVDDDVRLSAAVDKESLHETLKKSVCDAKLDDSITPLKEGETSITDDSESKTDVNSAPDNVERDVDESEGSKSSVSSKSEEAVGEETEGEEDKSIKETLSKGSSESNVKGDGDDVVRESVNNFSSSGIQEKIDVNKLRESLMTKCANVSISSSEISQVPDLSVPKSDLVLVNALHPETGALMTPPVDGGEKSEVDEDIPKVGLSGDDGVTKENPSEAADASSSISNKGDVGSQLSILGKLQQRLSFVTEGLSDEEVQEKEEEVTAPEECESVVGDGSCSSSSDNEEEDKMVGKAGKGADKVATKEDKGVAEAGKEASKVSEEASTKDEIPSKEDELSSAETDKVIKKGEVVKETETYREDDEVEKTVVEEKEKEGVSKDVDKKDEEEITEDEPAEKVAEEDKESLKNDEESEQQKLSKPNDKDADKEKSHLTDASKEPVSEKEGPLMKEKSIEKLGEEPENVQKTTKSKVKAPEPKSSDIDGPVSPKKPKLLELKDNDTEQLHVKSKASLKIKTEEVLEEEVLNREVLKESNMVVVQKTVKTRRFEEDATPPSAPKRARKGIAQKAMIVDRSDSPGQDELFPSMFLDPSVTITVLQESEKENGDNKEQVTSPPSVEELRTSVNLSNDVSLTMVRPSVTLEGLAAAQDCALSRSSEQNQVDIVGVPSQNPVPSASPQFRPRARKSFPRPSPRGTVRSPQSLSQSPSSMEVKRIPISMNGRDMTGIGMNLGASQGRTLSSGVSPTLPLALRGMSAQPPVPITSLAFSSSPTLSTASTSQPLVHSMVSQIMPPSSVMVTCQSSSASTSVRLPHLQPRPSAFPLSGPQPIFAPAEAGPVSAEFSKHAHKLANYMRVAIEEILGDLSRMGNAEASVKLLKMELERMKWEHQQEIQELKHNQDLVIMEVRNSLEKERMRQVAEMKRTCEMEKLRAIEETKRKQWCANCSKEALFYCCWNTSYCDYPCQQAHWPRHMSSCAQNNGMAESGDGDSGPSGVRKDGNSSGHKGMPGAPAAPPLPFHQLHRPGGASQESLPEEEYYDEDSNSPSTPRMGTSGGSYRIKRRRCGLCKGCLVKNNCGSCAPCRNSKTHQVCRMRRCRSLQSDWVPMSSSGSGTPTRPMSPEPAPLTVSLKTPPLTYASKRKRGSNKSSRLSSLSSVPVNTTASASYSVQPEQRNGEVLNLDLAATTANISVSQSVLCGGSLISQARPLPASQSQQQASTMELPSQSIGPPMVHPHILSQAMNPYMFPLPFSQHAPHSHQTHPDSEHNRSHSKESLSNPQKSFPHAQQPHSHLQQTPFSLHQPHLNPQPSHAQTPRSHPQPAHYPQQPHLQPEQHHSFLAQQFSQTQQRPISLSQQPHLQPRSQNVQPPQIQNPNLPPPLHKSHNPQPSNSVPRPSYMQNPYLYPPFAQNSLLSVPYAQGTNPHSSISHPSNSHPSISHPSKSHPSNSQYSNSHPSNSHLSNSHPSNSHPSNSHPSNSHPSNSHPSNSHPSNSHPSNSHPSNSHPSNSHPSNSHPSNSHPSNSHPTASKHRSRNQSNSRSHSPHANNRLPSPQPPILNPPYALFSSTSILMPRVPNPPNPHQYFFPNSCDIPSSSLAEQHQIHRQRMAAGVDLFTESMRLAARPSYFV